MIKVARTTMISTILIAGLCLGSSSSLGSGAGDDELAIDIKDNNDET